MLANMSPPARLPWYLSKKREVTPWMMMGTLIHHAITEPDRPFPALAVVPETYGPDAKKWNGNATECKDWRKQQEEAKRIILTRAQYDAVVECTLGIANDPDCQAIFAKGQSEVSVFTSRVVPNSYSHGEYSIFTKCRIDRVPTGSNSLVDIKKVGEGMAQKDAFMRLAVDRRYHVQAASYLDNWNAQMGSTDRRETFVFVVVEDVAPYLVNRIEIGRDTLAAGREIYYRDLETFARCKALSKWPGYPPGIQIAEASEWQLRRAA
jgi:exodeoxyribonuclease VIII